MAIERVEMYRIVCDNPACNTTASDYGVDNDWLTSENRMKFPSRMKLLVAAERAGYWVRGEKCFCPACREKMGLR
jgi:hypothetical protein